MNPKKIISASKPCVSICRKSAAQPSLAAIPPYLGTRSKPPLYPDPVRMQHPPAAVRIIIQPHHSPRPYKKTQVVPLPEPDLEPEKPSPFLSPPRSTSVPVVRSPQSLRLEAEVIPPRIRRDPLAVVRDERKSPEVFPESWYESDSKYGRLLSAAVARQRSKDAGAVIMIPDPSDFPRAIRMPDGVYKATISKVIHVKKGQSLGHGAFGSVRAAGEHWVVKKIPLTRKGIAAYQKKWFNQRIGAGQVTQRMLTEIRANAAREGFYGEGLNQLGAGNLAMRPFIAADKHGRTAFYIVMPRAEIDLQLLFCRADMLMTDPFIMSAWKAASLEIQVKFGGRIIDQFQDAAPSLLSEDNPFPLMLLSLLPQAAEGLNRLHQLGFMHRDIKLENMVMTKTGEVRLADMGSVGEVHDPSAHGMRCGTLSYLPPELIADYFLRSKAVPSKLHLRKAPSVGQEHDRWAFGCVASLIFRNHYPYDRREDCLKDDSRDVDRILRYRDPETRVASPMDGLICALTRRDPKARIRMADVVVHPAMQLLVEINRAMTSLIQRVGETVAFQNSVPKAFWHVGLSLCSRFFFEARHSEIKWRTSQRGSFKEAIRLAAKAGARSVVEDLTRKLGPSAIIEAIEEDDTATAAEFIRTRKINLYEIKNKYGVAAIHYAAASCRVEILSLMHDAGVDLLVPDAHGASSLFYAAEKGHLKGIEFLKEKYTLDLRHKNADGHDALYVAMYAQKKVGVQVLIALGVATCPGTELVPYLERAATLGWQSIVKLLLKQESLTVLLVEEKAQLRPKKDRILNRIIAVVSARGKLRAEFQRWYSRVKLKPTYQEIIRLLDQKRREIYPPWYRCCTH